VRVERWRGRERWEERRLRVVWVGREEVIIT
jgi:hypothetical protein